MCTYVYKEVFKATFCKFVSVGIESKVFNFSHQKIFHEKLMTEIVPFLTTTIDLSPAFKMQ